MRFMWVLCMRFMRFVGFVGECMQRYNVPGYVPICRSSSSHPSKRVMVWMSASLVYQFEKTLLHAGAVALLRVWEDSESELESASAAESVSRLGA